ncbi:DNA-binding protein c1d [Mortierella sp. AM989]|nr:DNA-binding protein c1d [Mortierella sp. AM989]
MPPAKVQPEATLGQTLPNNHKNATNVLLSSLSELEEMLAPLTATSNSLSETLAKLDSEKRCQLELILAYAINTFAFINLKSNGHPAANHPVMQELKRIKVYTEKLRHVTHGNKANMEVDKNAAERFIRGALAANIAADRKSEAEAEAETEPQATHTRFDNEKGSNSEQTEPSSSTKTTSTRKRGMDPFHGYGEDKKSKSG